MAVSANLLLPRYLGTMLLLLLFVLGSSEGAKVATVDVHAAKNLILTGYIFLDVRTVEEFVKGHVDATKIINIPYKLDSPKGRVTNPDFLKEVSSACNKEDHIIVGCKIGVRSLNATSDLLDDGFKNVINMGGGYDEWIRNKYPVITLVSKEEL